MKKTSILIILIFISTVVIATIFILVNRCGTDVTIKELNDNKEKCLNKKIRVSGYIVEDNVYAKPNKWPEPARLRSFLQNESGLPVGTSGGSRNLEAISIYSNTTNLRDFEQKYVIVEGYLRKIYINKSSSNETIPYYYIEVTKVIERSN